MSFLAFTEAWAEHNIEEEDENEAVPPTPKQTKKGHYYNPKSAKKLKWEEDRDRDDDPDNNNVGGMGAGQPQGITVM